MALERDWRWYVTDDGELVERTWQAFVDGTIPWDDLDDEELSRMRLRDKNGGWMGSAPTRVPRELRKRVTQRGLELMQEKDQQIAMASQLLRAQMVADDTLDPAIRLKAGMASEDRARGKTPEKIELQAEVKPWEGIIDSIVVDV